MELPLRAGKMTPSCDVRARAWMLKSLAVRRLSQAVSLRCLSLRIALRKTVQQLEATAVVEPLLRKLAVATLLTL